MTCDKCFLSLRWFCSMIKWALSEWRVKLSNGEFSLLVLGTLLFWMQNRMRTPPTVGKVPAKLEHPHGLAVEISEKERAHECLDCRVHRYWMASMNSISNTILGLHPSHSTQTTRFYVIRGDICLGGHPFLKKNLLAWRSRPLLHAFISYFISCIHAFVHLFHSFFPFVHSFLPSCLHSIFPSCIRSFISSFLHVFNPFFLHAFIPLFLPSFCFFSFLALIHQLAQAFNSTARAGCCGEIMLRTIF